LCHDEVRGSATLRVECNVPDAAVLLDDVLLGRASELRKNDKFIRPAFIASRSVSLGISPISPKLPSQKAALRW